MLQSLPFLLVDGDFAPWLSCERLQCMYPTDKSALKAWTEVNFYLQCAVCLFWWHHSKRYSACDTDVWRETEASNTTGFKRWSPINLPHQKTCHSKIRMCILATLRLNWGFVGLSFMLNCFRFFCICDTDQYSVKQQQHWYCFLPRRSSAPDRGTSSPLIGWLILYWRPTLHHVEAWRGLINTANTITPQRAETDPRETGQKNVQNIKVRNISGWWNLNYQ